MEKTKKRGQVIDINSLKQYYVEMKPILDPTVIREFPEHDEIVIKTRQIKLISNTNAVKIQEGFSAPLERMIDFEIQRLKDKVDEEINKLLENGANVYVDHFRFETNYNMHGNHVISFTYQIEEEYFYKRFFFDGVTNDGLDKAFEQARMRVNSKIEKSYEEAKFRTLNFSFYRRIR